MKLLRTILLVIIAATLPLPSVAAMLGAQDCASMSMSMTDNVASMEHAAHAEHQQMARADEAAADQSHDCCDSQCPGILSCNGPCAVGVAPAIPGMALIQFPARLSSAPIAVASVQLQAAFPDDLIRPPARIHG